MLDGARFKRLAIQRVDSPVGNALNISSRSDSINYPNTERAMMVRWISDEPS